MPKRNLLHPALDFSMEDISDIDSARKIASKRGKKTPKKMLNMKPNNFFSEPESLFLHFDPKKMNNKDDMTKSLEESDLNVCTQPVTRTVLRTGKMSWQPPTKQSFSSNKCVNQETNFDTSSELNKWENIKSLNNTVDIEPLKNTVDIESLNNTVDIESLNSIVDIEPLNSTVDIEPLNSTVDIEPLNNTVDIEPLNNTVDKENCDTTENIDNVTELFTDNELKSSSQGKTKTIHMEENPQESKIETDELNTKNTNCVPFSKSDEEENYREENSLFELMDVHEIDELIEKKIDDHLSAECELDIKKTESETISKNITSNQIGSKIDDHLSAECVLDIKKTESGTISKNITSNEINTATLVMDDSDEEFNINISDELKALDEKEKLLQEDEDRLLEISPTDKDCDMTKYTSIEDESLEILLEENENTVIKSNDDKEENEFDLTISNSQLLQIESEYSKICETKYSESSTQTVPILELQNSMGNVPQMMGGVKKMKNDIQKITQCVQELKKINAVLIKARKEISMQRNTPPTWNSSGMKKSPHI